MISSKPIRLIILIAIVVAAVAFYSQRTMAPSDIPSETVSINVEGMVCSSCELKVKTALTDLPEVISVNVDHISGETEILVDSRKDRQKTIQKIDAEIKKLGYKVKSNLNVLDYQFKGSGEP